MDYSLLGSSVQGDSPGKNAGVGCPALLQGIFPTQGLNPGLPNCWRILYHLSHQGSPYICIYMVASDFPPLIWERLLQFMQGNASTIVVLIGAGLCEVQHNNWLKGPPQMLVSRKVLGSCYSSAAVIKQILSEKNQSFGSLSSTMAVDENKSLMKGGKKGAKMKVVDPF